MTTEQRSDIPTLRYGYPARSNGVAHIVAAAVPGGEPDAAIARCGVVVLVVSTLRADGFKCAKCMRWRDHWLAGQKASAPPKKCRE